MILIVVLVNFFVVKRENLLIKNLIEIIVLLIFLGGMFKEKDVEF